MCFFHCPFDPIYEKGDSVALAVLSGNLNIPESSIYSEVCIATCVRLIFFFFFVHKNFLPYNFGKVVKCVMIFG